MYISREDPLSVTSVLLAPHLSGGAAGGQRQAEAHVNVLLMLWSPVGLDTYANATWSMITQDGSFSMSFCLAANKSAFTDRQCSSLKEIHHAQKDHLNITYSRMYPFILQENLLLHNSLKRLRSV